VRDFFAPVWKISVFMKILHLFCALAIVAGVLAAKADGTNPVSAVPAVPAAPSFTDPSKLTAMAPETYKAQFITTKGKFVIEVTRSLARMVPTALQPGSFRLFHRHRLLPRDTRFHVPIRHPRDPSVSAKWRDANINDDAVKGSNTRGTITFATPVQYPHHPALH